MREASRWQINPAWAALPLEAAAGAIFFGHGLQKLMDPASFAANIIIPRLSLPGYLSYLVIAAELGGAILLLLGLFVRLGAFGHLCVMTTAISFIHWSRGLMGEGGYEFPLALLAASLALLVIGADPLSIDENIGILAGQSRESTVRGHRDFIDVSRVRIKIAGLILILLGIALPILHSYLGIPQTRSVLVITILAGIASVIPGIFLVVGKFWAYGPGFVMARLNLGGAFLLLFWVKYTIRGIAAILICLIMLGALRSARRSVGW